MARRSRHLTVEAADLALESPFGDLADALADLAAVLRTRLGTHLASGLSLAVIGYLLVRAFRSS